jgi:hypothetical protein
MIQGRIKMTKREKLVAICDYISCDKLSHRFNRFEHLDNIQVPTFKKGDVEYYFDQDSNLFVSHGVNTEISIDELSDEEIDCIYTSYLEMLIDYFSDVLIEFAMQKSDIEKIIGKVLILAKEPVDGQKAQIS